MDREDLLELIQLQLVKVVEQVGAQTSRGENTDRTLGLLRSLRLTLGALLGGIDPVGGLTSSFVLSVSDQRRMVLRRDHHLATLTGTFFPSMFRLGGISPPPGQVLFVEPEVARRAIEDSLGETLAEEFRIARERTELRTALQGSSDPRRDQVLRALGRLDGREADLLVAKVELAEMNLAVQRS
jgi:hypothetical protein